MRCSKCNGRMVENGSGYLRANVSSGFGTPLPRSYSCIICGMYAEFYEDSGPVPPVVKPVKAAPGISPITNKKPNNYPSKRKPQGEKGWLIVLVKKYMDDINSMVGNGLLWREVLSNLKEVDVKFSGITHNSLYSVHRRLQKHA